MKNKQLVISIIIILWVVIIVGIVSLYVFSKTNDTIILSDGDINEVVATVNGEQIKRLDLNYRKYTNKELNEKGEDTNLKENDEEIKKELIRQKLLAQEAKKNNVELSEDEKKAVTDSFGTKITEGDKKVAATINMSGEEYLNFIVNTQLEEKLASKMYNQIFQKLLKDEIDVDDEEFKKNMEEYRNTEEINNRMSILEKACESYIDYLNKTSDIA